MPLLYFIADGDDYRIDSTIVNVTAGEMSKSFTINIINDDIAECDETFKLTFIIPTPPCEVVNGRNNISDVIIKDNDGRGCTSV